MVVLVNEQLLLCAANMVRNTPKLAHVKFLRAELHRSSQGLNFTLLLFLTLPQYEKYEDMGNSQNRGIKFCTYFKNMHMQKCAGVITLIINS